MNIDVLGILKELETARAKDPVLFKALQKKINQIASCNNEVIKHFKNLRAGLCDYKRVHVGSFVLMFKVEKDTVIFCKFCHHDEAYEM